MNGSSKKIAFIFPGQGSQVVGMGKDFFQNFKSSATVFEEASDTIRLNLKKLCFDGPVDQLTLTENLQPALFTVEAAILAAVKSESGLSPIVCAGHSLGEYAALYAAGSLTVEDGARLTHLRGKAMQNAVPVGVGSMVAVLGLDAEKITILCKKAIEQEPTKGTVEPANYNAPGQIVLAGTVEHVKRACQLLSNDPDFKGGKSIPLQVSAPFHCSLMRPAQKEMEDHITSTTFQDLNSWIIPNCNALPSQSKHEIAGYLLDQIIMPVRWEQSVLKLRQLGVDGVYEIGPGKVLAGLHKRIDREMKVWNISTIEQFKEYIK